eukprot:TRINITY_DN85079_c0_g1_i1.p1 TRINITY_DN85079_c0_g1~~TRINITY_DN85079_c0_g1_i1.p1  ORF type:complete len:153 (+),score=14.71 TRINITY_DN85079_c0_g1_i1:86-544(+)
MAVTMQRANGTAPQGGAPVPVGYGVNFTAGQVWSQNFDTCAVAVMINLENGAGSVYHLCPDQYQHGKGLNVDCNGRPRPEAGGTTDRLHVNDIWTQFVEAHGSNCYCMVCGPQTPVSGVLSTNRRFVFNTESGFTSIMYDSGTRQLTLYSGS